MTMRIDAHQHFWQLARGDYGWLTPDMTAIYRDFTPDDLRPLIRTHGVEATIAVQAAPTTEETEYLLELAQAHSWIAGVVGWVDLAARDADKTIRSMAQAYPKLVGLRPMIQDITDDLWMLHDALSPAFTTMAELDLTFDALVLPRHLSPLTLFLERYPALKVVIDHGAKPAIRAAAFEPWASEMKTIAHRFPETVCKLSGLLTEARADQSIADLAPYMTHLQQTFGPDRLIFGSDWPVLNTAGDYSSWIGAVEKFISGWSTAEQKALMGGNAARVYPRLVLP